MSISDIWYIADTMQGMHTKARHELLSSLTEVDKE